MHLSLAAGFGFAVLASAFSARGQSEQTVSGKADSFVERADRALALGRLEEAAVLARARGADDPAAAAVRARIVTLQGRYAEAEAIAAPAAARAPASEAALVLGLLQTLTGRRVEAAKTLTQIVEASPSFTEARDLFRAALAARALGEYREANALFREAIEAHPDDPAINAAWGDLFLEKYNRKDAVRSYEAAIAADAEWAPAYLGLARSVLEDDAAKAKALAERALAINSSSVGAHLLLAELALDDGRHDDAGAAIGRALALNAASLEARSLLAAAANLAGRQKEFETEVARVLAINPTYGEVYRVAADHAARNYRFDEAVALVRRAIAIDAENSRANADLGVHLLRTGDESGARQALERAFRADPFDVITYNLLGLLDTLDKFETISEGDVTLRLHPEEAPVLREYALPLAQEALRQLSTRYQFKPTGPILIEIFPRHDDFAVRNVGLPGMIGALGACFGRVVTMDSPRARPPGTFSWSATLWHELAHVITLQMSNQRVPRWLTEGISVYEEKRARPEWGREMEVPFVRALNHGQILKLRDLNGGFHKPETIALAYFEASLLVEHLIDRHGEAGLHKLLGAYGEGLETDAALTKGLGTTLDRLQESFTRAIEAKFGTLARALREPAKIPSGGELQQLATAEPDNYTLQLILGQMLRAAGDLDGAIRVFERAVALVPMAPGKESARALLIAVSEQKGDRDRAIRELEALLGYDHTDVEAARHLAELAKPAGDDKRLRLAYERVVALDPFDAGAHAELGRLALQQSEADTAAREFRAALAAGPVDKAAAYCDLAESYLLAGRLGDAKRGAIAALEIAPSYERAQELLLKVIEARP